MASKTWEPISFGPFPLTALVLSTLTDLFVLFHLFSHFDLTDGDPGTVYQTDLSMGAVPILSVLALQFLTEIVWSFFYAGRKFPTGLTHWVRFGTTVSSILVSILFYTYDIRAAICPYTILAVIPAIGIVLTFVFLLTDVRRLPKTAKAKHRERQKRQSKTPLSAKDYGPAGHTFTAVTEPEPERVRPDSVRGSRHIASKPSRYPAVQGHTNDVDSLFADTDPAFLQHDDLQDQIIRTAAEQSGVDPSKLTYNQEPKKTKVGSTVDPEPAQKASRKTALHPEFDPVRESWDSPPADPDTKRRPTLSSEEVRD